MKKGSSTSRIFTLMILLLCCFPNTYLGQASPISGTVNTYGVVTTVDTAANTVSLADPVFAASLGLNDLVLIYQTQGAAIQTGTTNASFGTITSLNGAGSFEFGRVCNIDGSNVAIDNKLVNTYYNPAVSNASIQMIRVPEYTDAEVIGSLTADAWDGDKGGIVALSVLDTLTITGSINVSEDGFRGGIAIENTSSNCSFFAAATAYAFPSAIGAQFVGGQKGEGIAAYTAGQEYGRGAQANGGGGGNGHNSGGAGGGNAGAGGIGGNRVAGGFFPCQGDWPGEPGKSLSAFGYSAGNQRAFMGGGGGAGEDNNGESEDGGTGGGLVLIMANVITGTGTIQSNGGDVVLIGSDGNGGGGAGGSILLNANVIDGAGLTLTATGGNGGTTKINCEGPGGGGAGGVIWSSVGLGGATTDVTGGTAGVAQACGNNNQGAGNGGVGQVITSGLAPPQGTNPVPCILQTPIVLQHTGTDQFAQLFWESQGSPVAEWALQKQTSTMGWESIRRFQPGETVTTISRSAFPRMFRIQALGPDGQIRYSNQLEIEAFHAEQLTALVLQDGEMTTLQVTGTLPDRPVRFSIIEPNGKRIRTEQIISSQQVTEISLPVQEIAAGYYVIRVHHEGSSLSLPLLILR